MISVIHGALEEEAKFTRESGYVGPGGKLLSTDMGRCHRKAIFRIEKMERSFEPNVRVMNDYRQSEMFKGDTLNALYSTYGDKAKFYEKLEHESWVARPDAIIEHPDGPIIATINGVGGKWFDFGHSLPKERQVARLCLEGWLYEKIHGVFPTLVAFYRSWESWAEFFIDWDQHGDTVQAQGWVNGKADMRILGTRPRHERHLLQGYFDSKSAPPALLDKTQGCTYKGGGRCEFYAHCWDD